MSGNLKPFVLQSSTAVAFTLEVGGSQVLNETYYPGNGNLIEIDLREVVESYLSFTFPSSDVFNQTLLVRSFTAKFDGQTVSFNAIRAGKARLNQSASEFLKENFLTWQPQVKPVTYYSPEWLTYYAVETCRIKLKAYFEDGTSSETTLSSPSAGTCYTLNLQYGVVSGKFSGKRPTYYDVWIESTGGQRLTYVQRYIGSPRRSEDENWYLFENSLGGLDSLRAYGSLDDAPEYEHNVSQLDGVLTEYRVDTNRKYTRNTGYLTPQESAWLQDMFSSRQKYAYTASGYYKIVFTASDGGRSSTDLPSSYSFTYQFAEDLPFLDIQRREDLPDNLELKTPEGETFFLPPRLAEFPKLSLSPDLLLPAQEPHTEKWGTITAGTLKDTVLNELIEQLQGLDMNHTSGGGGGIGDYYVIKTGDLTLPSDENVFSAARTLVEINKAFQKPEETFDKRYLRKDIDDTALGNIRFQKNISSETFATGLLGTGWRITGDGDMEARSLFLREWLEVSELRYNRITVTGDEFWVATGLKVDRVEGNTIYAKLEEGEIIAVKEGDILRGIYQHENGFSTSFINVLTVDSKAGSFTYEKIRGADPVKFMTFARQGNDKDEERQRSIYLSGLDGYQRFLGGVNSADITFDNIYAQFGNLNGLVTPYFGTLSGEGIYIRKGYIEGSIYVTGGNAATTDFVSTEIGKEIAKLSVGVDNLLLNTGFTGDYTTIDLAPDTDLEDGTHLFSDPLKFWDVAGAASVGTDVNSRSGYACVLSGTISQKPIVPIQIDEYYTISFKAKGSGSITVGVGGDFESFILTSSYQRYVAKIQAVSQSEFSLEASASATICEIKLERGTIATDWEPSSSDNDKSEAQSIAYKYVLDAIQNETSIYGGLVLTNIIMVGNYTNGKMSAITGGISGVYNDGNDVAFWAGGTLDQAIKAVSNPSLTTGVANAVITHGGMAILNNAYVRGKVYATDGYFSGEVYATSGILQNVVVRTKESGQRIEFDSKGQKIAIYNSDNKIIGEWSYVEKGSQITLKYGDNELSNWSSDSIGFSGPDGISALFSNKFEVRNGDNPYEHKYFQVNTIGDYLNVIMGKIPDSKEKSSAWGLYRDGDTIKINAIV